MRVSIPMVLLALAVGCADQTGLLIEVNGGDLAVPADVDALRFQIVSDQGRRVDETYGIQSAWPHSLSLLPGPGDRVVRIAVTGLRAGTPRVRRVVDAIFESERNRLVSIQLWADCLDVACDDGVDCVRGRCVDVAELDGGVAFDGGPVRDGGPENDGGADAGDGDAGIGDSGAEDAGQDAGGADAGVDAGPAALTCLGGDGSTCLGVIVISEVTPHGPAGADDEFVELYNRSDEDADISGLQLFYQALTTEMLRATVPPGVVLPPGGFYLIGANGYVGPTPDLPNQWSGAQGLAASRGAVLIRSGPQILDLVGWEWSGNTLGTPPSEGAPVEGAATTDYVSQAISHERKARADSTVETMSPGGRDHLAGNGHDTDDNAADFVNRAPREPQNMASPPQPRL